VDAALTVIKKMFSVLGKQNGKQKYRAYRAFQQDSTGDSAI